MSAPGGVDHVVARALLAVRIGTDEGSPTHRRWAMDWREVWLVLIVASGVFLVAATELLGELHALRSGPVRLAWLGWVVILGLTTFRLRNRMVVVWPKLRPPSGTAVVVLAGLGAIILVAGVVAWFAPPNTSDSMSYHMSRVANWAQHQSVADYPTPTVLQLYQPPWAEFAMLHLQLLTQSDRLANFVQFGSMLSALAVVSFITRLLGGGSRTQLSAAVFVGALPVGVLQASSTQNDYVAAMWLSTFAASVLLVRRHLKLRARTGLGDSAGGDWLPYVMAGASLGLAICAKGTSYFFAGPFVLLLVGLHLRHINRSAVARLALVAAIAVVINAGPLIRNELLFQAPLGPIAEEADGTVGYQVTEIRWNGFLSNVVRNVGMQLGTPIGPVNDAITDEISWMHERLGIWMGSPLTSWPGTEFHRSTVEFSLHESTAGNLLATLLIVVTVVVGTAGGLLGFASGLLGNHSGRRGDHPTPQRDDGTFDSDTRGLLHKDRTPLDGYPMRLGDNRGLQRDDRTPLDGNRTLDGDNRRLERDDPTPLDGNRTRVGNHHGPLGNDPTPLDRDRTRVGDNHALQRDDPTPLDCNRTPIGDNRARRGNPTPVGDHVARQGNPAPLGANFARQSNPAPRGDNPALLGYSLAWGAGFAVFCLVLRWQPWGNRLDLPWFVLAAPVVSTVLARRPSRGALAALGLVLVLAAAPLLQQRVPLPGGRELDVIAVALGLLVLLAWRFRRQLSAAAEVIANAMASKRAGRASWLLLNLVVLIGAVPYAILNQTRPLLGEQSVVRTPRVTQMFVALPELEDPYRNSVAQVQAVNCHQVGLLLGTRDWDYPLWLLLRGPGDSNVQLEYLNVTNPSANLPPPRFVPCAVLATIEAPASSLVVDGKPFHANEPPNGKITVFLPSTDLD